MDNNPGPISRQTSLFSSLCDCALKKICRQEKLLVLEGTGHNFNLGVDLNLLPLWHFGPVLTTAPCYSPCFHINTFLFPLQYTVKKLVSISYLFEEAVYSATHGFYVTAAKAQCVFYYSGQRRNSSYLCLSIVLPVQMKVRTLWTSLIGSGAVFIWVFVQLSSEVLKPHRESLETDNIFPSPVGLLYLFSCVIQR